MALDVTISVLAIGAWTSAVDRLARFSHWGVQASCRIRGAHASESPRTDQYPHLRWTRKFSYPDRYCDRQVAAAAVQESK